MTRSTDHTPRPALVACVLGAVFLASALPVIVLGIQRGRMASDQLVYHEVVVRIFARDLPGVDLSDYRSATTPGYHLVIAAATRMVGSSRPVLQLVGCLFTLGLVVVLGWAVGSRAPPMLALAVAAPVLTSLYVWPAGVWLLPDNAGWLGVLALVLIALMPRLRVRDLAVASVVLALLVLVRQIHLWAIAPVWAAAWLGPARPDDPSSGPLERIDPSAELGDLLSNPAARIKRTALALATILPAAAILVVFARLWGGLTPPMFQGTQGQVTHTGLNPATGAFVLTLVGLIGLAFVGFWGPRALVLARSARGWLIVSAALGAAIALVPATTYSQADGRWTGVVWKIVQHAPTVGGRTSPVIVAGSMLGCVVLVSWLSSLSRRDRWIVLAVFVAFIAAQTASAQLWQRYCEPIVLILFALMAVRTIVPEPTRGLDRAARPLRLLGPAALAAVFALGTAASIATSPGATPDQLAFPIEQARPAAELPAGP